MGEREGGREAYTNSEQNFQSNLSFNDFLPASGSTKSAEALRLNVFMSSSYREEVEFAPRPGKVDDRRRLLLVLCGDSSGLN